jgi:hypothetical protein
MAAGVAVVAGSVAQRPRRGGHTWVFLQYLLGLRALGWDVVLLDRLEPDMAVDAGGEACEPERSENVRYLTDVLERFGLGDSYALLLEGGRRTLGLSRDEALERVAASSIFLNVNGFIDDPELLARAPLRVFLDIDPGFGQMWRELGLHDPFKGHDAYVTVGEGIGRRNCSIPTCGLDWITTPQPIVLAEWPQQDGPAEAFTSVGSWRGPFGPIEYEGVTYGLRVHECRKFAELPRRSRERFELALDIDEADSADVSLLRANGWTLVDPLDVAADPWRYRGYVQRSKAELMIAKNIYVRSRSGWFSDRSICYLASGRPVLAQETGFSSRYPTGEGLLAFETLEQAVEGASAIAAEYERHARAARELAESHFESSKVLSRLLERLEVA